MWVRLVLDAFLEIVLVAVFQPDFRCVFDGDDIDSDPTSRVVLELSRPRVDPRRRRCFTAGRCRCPASPVAASSTFASRRRDGTALGQPTGDHQRDPSARNAEDRDVDVAQGVENEAQNKQDRAGHDQTDGHK